MASIASRKTDAVERRSLGVSRLAIAAAATTVVAFVFCWIGTFVPLSSPTHAYSALFTNAPVNSLQALAEGALWSLLFGALVGVLFGVAYNATAGLGRR